MPRFKLTRMTGRNRGERRAATPFELFFDLVFVVSVSFASENLHEIQTHGSVWAGFGAYAMVFFAIWWAWMNFTWFATAFDTDDWLYRLTTIVQMGGALVLAAGTESAMQDGDFSVVTAGYVVMTLAIVSQWTRAAIQSPTYRQACVRHAVGAFVVQLAWIFRLMLPSEIGFAAFFVLVAAELAVPVVADHRNWTPSNPHHVAERYGLFTLIVLGEGLLAAAQAIIAAIHTSDQVVALTVIGGAGLVIVSAMWWSYFASPLADGFSTYRSSFLYGYGHYFVFAAAGAVSAGLQTIAVAQGAGEGTKATELSTTLTVPIVVFAFAVWVMVLRRELKPQASVAAIGVILVLATLTFVPSRPIGIVVISALLLTAIVVLVVVSAPQPQPQRGASPTT